MSKTNPKQLPPHLARELTKLEELAVKIYGIYVDSQNGIPPGAENIKGILRQGSNGLLSHKVIAQLFKAQVGSDGVVQIGRYRHNQKIELSTALKRETGVEVNRNSLEECVESLRWLAHTRRRNGDTRIIRPSDVNQIARTGLLLSATGLKMPSSGTILRTLVGKGKQWADVVRMAFPDISEREISHQLNLHSTISDLAIDLSRTATWIRSKGETLPTNGSGPTKAQIERYFSEGDGLGYQRYRDFLLAQRDKGKEYSLDDIRARAGFERTDNVPKHRKYRIHFTLESAIDGFLAAWESIGGIENVACPTIEQLGEISKKQSPYVIKEGLDLDRADRDGVEIVRVPVPTQGYITPPERRAGGPNGIANFLGLVEKKRGVEIVVNKYRLGQLVRNAREMNLDPKNMTNQVRNFIELQNPNMCR